MGQAEQQNREKFKTLLTETGSSNTKHHILIVEDNAVNRKLLKSYLKNEYEISEAENGKEAINQAKNSPPDLIISDILMPQTDGFTLCEVLKNDKGTCHIPIIMLTGLSSDEDQINALDIGADDYLTKPVKKKILLARVKTILQNRNIWKQKYQDLNIIYDSSSIAEEQDEFFLKRVIEIIEENLASKDFHVEDLANELCMSSKQLSRKLKSINQQTPNSFIRKVRLRKALQLLQSQKFSVKEVSFMVGFDSVRYFREKFKAEVGANPSTYTKGKG